MRVRYGLAPIDVTVTEFAGRMPLYLMPSVPEFDYDRTDLPDSVHYVGPCSWDKPSTEPSAEWIAGLSDDRPVVHVTEATIHTHQPLLLKAAAQGLAGEPMQVVMTTGEHRSLDELNLGPPAPNIRIEAYVPHSDLMPKTSVVVCLGGAGTVFAALKAGVPLVVVPTEWDKPENAQRVVEAGAGLRIEPRKLTAARLRAAVHRSAEQELVPRQRPAPRDRLQALRGRGRCGAPARRTGPIPALGITATAQGTQRRKQENPIQGG